jgi:DNA-binding MarR family transcriptional regulator
MTHEEEMRKVLEEAAAIRPRLTNKSDLAMLDSLVARLRGDAKGGLTAIADEIGITKGAASKVAQRLKKEWPAKNNFAGLETFEEIRAIYR